MLNFILGTFSGVLIGFVIACLCAARGQAERHAEMQAVERLRAIVECEESTELACGHHERYWYAVGDERDGWSGCIICEMYRQGGIANQALAEVERLQASLLAEQAENKLQREAYTEEVVECNMVTAQRVPVAPLTMSE
jgi:hypothetical protein